MDKLEKLMQDVMKTIQRQGFMPDSVELKIKVEDNWYSVKWKKPVVYASDEDFESMRNALDKKSSGGK